MDKLGGTGAYLIFDRGIRERGKAVELYDHIGMVKTGTDLETLATATGLDAATRKQTVADWNQAVANHNDAAFNRTTVMDLDIAA
nr:hypothetical protein [Lactiplantibacillus plantarum]